MQEEDTPTPKSPSTDAQRPPGTYRRDRAEIELNDADVPSIVENFDSAEEETTESETDTGDLCELDYPRLLSSSDTHRPVELRHAQSPERILYVLENAAQKLLTYAHHLSEEQQDYLSFVQRHLRKALRGQTSWLVDKITIGKHSVWDICWLIYFELTQHMSEEDGNFLSQAFHGRTATVSCEDIMPEYKRRKQKGKTVCGSNMKQRMGESRSSEVVTADFVRSISLYGIYQRPCSSAASVLTFKVKLV